MDWGLIWRNELLSFFNHLAAALPWLLAIIGGGAVVGYSPLGRSLLRFQRERERTNEALESIGSQLGTLHQSLTDVTERLDATEFQLRALKAPEPKPRPRVDETPRPRTPV